jgi:hypothetical protein
MTFNLPFAVVTIAWRGLLAAKLSAKWMRFRSSIVDVEYPRESHCDQCDLQGVCDYLHDRSWNYRDCKAYPRVYRLPNKVIGPKSARKSVRESHGCAD